MLKVRLPAQPDSSSLHFQRGIIYVNNDDTALQKRRDEFDQCIASVDEKFDHPGEQMNVMEQLIALSIKHKHLSDP